MLKISSKVSGSVHADGQKIIAKPWAIVKFLLCASASDRRRLAPGSNASIMHLATSSQVLSPHRQLTPVSEGLLQIEPNRRSLPVPSAPVSRKRGRLFVEGGDLASK